MMGRVKCYICDEKIPPDELCFFYGYPLCREHSNEISGEIDRLRAIHKSGIVAPLTEEEIHNWAETFKQTLQRPIERLDLDQKEIDLAWEVITKIDKAIKGLGFGVAVEKVDPSTLRLLYLKLDELECYVNKSKKTIVGVLASWAGRLK